MSGEAHRITPSLARSRRRPIRVLMLGWEYPPRLAGGLGKACQGLAQALSKQGAQVSFVLPTFPKKIIEPTLEVVGAREYLIESGWSPERLTEKMASSGFSQEFGGLTAIRSDAELYPYGSSPAGPVPKSIQVLMGDSGDVRVVSVDSQGRPQVVKSVASPVGPASKEIYGRNLWSEIERFVFSVRQLAETHEVDVVHAHDWMTFPAAFEYQRLTGSPVFLHVHATEYDRSGEDVNREVFRIERDGFRKADHIFAVSRYTAGIIQRLYGVNPKKISVVYNAPDDAAKTFAAGVGAEGRDAEGTDVAERQDEVIFLGRLTFQKGPDHFLRACALVAEAHSKARFVFCGTGDLFDQLRALSHRLGIEERVHFAGFVDPSSVDEILLRSKVLVMPSVSEPFGLVALEAIHCGIPVIISKQSGVREVLQRALQVDFWDHEKLADQILAALRLPELSRQLVEEGMNQVQALSWEKSAKKVVENYRSHFRRSHRAEEVASHGY